jgi:large subunit ribosomal protein L32
MTPLPKRRLSRERQGRRRASINFSLKGLSKCENCGHPKFSHEVCKNCGTYKGVVVVTPKIKTKVTKVEKTDQEKG